MPEEDFQKQILEALATLKKDITNLDSRIGTLEKSASLIFKTFTDQIKIKGSTCARVTKNPNGDEYCSVWQLKSIAKESENYYVYAGGRYYTKLGLIWCYSCVEYEKKK